MQFFFSLKHHSLPGSTAMLLKKLTAFCESFSTPPAPELLELERETHLKMLAPQMLCGHLQGQFLTMLSSLMRPVAILEIGTFTGYASICLAKGLPEGGILHTIEVNPECAWLCQKYFEKAGLQEKIRLHLGDAREIVPGLAENFDLVYLDAGKNDYLFFYDLVFEKVKSGGVILADNVLW
ncbi:MAG: O-methyltransferase, partial [Bacteroidota bacterium]